MTYVYLSSEWQLNQKKYMKQIVDDYFERGPMIELPGLKEQVKLPKNTWFRYDGEVGSLAQNIARTEAVILGIISPNQSRFERVIYWPIGFMALESGANEIRKQCPSIDNLAAYCNRHKIDDSKTAFVIAKKKGLNKSKSIFADGHESGELLAEIGQKKVMQDLLNKDKISLDASLYEGEDFADIGGLLALFKAIKNGETGIILPVFKTRRAVNKVLSAQFLL
jgi:hypothetical protein